MGSDPASSAAGLIVGPLQVVFTDDPRAEQLYEIFSG